MLNEQYLSRLPRAAANFGQKSCDGTFYIASKLGYEYHSGVFIRFKELLMPHL